MLVVLVFVGGGVGGSVVESKVGIGFYVGGGVGYSVEVEGDVGVGGIVGIVGVDVGGIIVLLEVRLVLSFCVVCGGYGVRVGGDVDVGGGVGSVGVGVGGSVVGSKVDIIKIVFVLVMVLFTVRGCWCFRVIYSTFSCWLVLLFVVVMVLVLVLYTGTWCSDMMCAHMRTVVWYSTTNF